MAVEQLYTTTVASFKLYGGYQQSQQYIEMAEKANPNVLLKILAHFQPPGISTAPFFLTGQHSTFSKANPLAVLIG